MPVSAGRVREMALALTDAAEAPHFDRVAFRTPRRIFATLDARAGDLNLMFDPEMRDLFCAESPEIFAPVPGGWGRKGATRCDLRAADEARVGSALVTAHRLAAAKRR